MQCRGHGNIVALSDKGLNAETTCTNYISQNFIFKLIFLYNRHLSILRTLVRVRRLKCSLNEPICTQYV